MRIKIGENKRLLNILLRTGICFLLCGCLLYVTPQEVKADVATDYISIRIGYQGWDLDEYVETGNYFWGDIEGMAYDSFYSYFSGNETTLRESDGGGTAFYEYTAIVDYAFGVDLRQLLEYAHVYYGDIYNILFWVEDHATIWCAFDRDPLFYGRYYYPDIAGNRTVYYDESERPYAYSFNDVGNQQEVSPMLALEDAWITFTEDADHSIVDEGTALWQRNSANRFRLLFGQNSITSSETNKSAKYVSTIYVTYWGAPSYGEMPELDGTIGSHQVDMQVSTETDMRYALSELMRLSSTDENVLQITGMEILPDEYYSDLTTVRIYYDIVGEGTAGIEAGIGRNSGMTQVTQAVNTDDFIQPDDKQGDEDDQDPDEEAENDENGSEDNTDGDGESGDNTGEDQETGDNGSQPNETGESDPPGTDPDNEGESTQVPDQENADAGQDQAAAEQNETVPEESQPQTDPQPTPVPEEQAEAEPAEEAVEKLDEIVSETAEIKEAENIETADLSENNNSLILMRKLSNSAARDIDEAIAEQEAERTASEMAIYSPQAANMDIEQLQIEDNTEEKEKEKRLILLCTGLACAGLAAAGAGSSVVNYRVCLKRERFYMPKHSFTKWLRGEK